MSSIHTNDWNSDAADTLAHEMQDINEQLVLNSVRLQHINDALTIEVARNRSIAEALQYSMLWQQPEKVFPGLRMAAFYEPAIPEALVGGDFFDAFALPDNSLMLVVGDVTGKGLQAAAHTVEVRFALRAFAQDYADPAKTLRRLNEFICDFHRDNDELADDALVVLSLVLLSPSRAVALAASAGAEWPLIFRASGIVEEIAAEGLILGIDRNASYLSTSVSLDFGDTLVMTTDGITETRHGRDFYGYERLINIARQASLSENLSDMGKSIMESAHSYSETELSDDVCILLARRDCAT